MKTSLLWFLFVLGQTAAGEPPPVVAVFPLENRGAPLKKTELEALGEYLAIKLGESGHYQIVPGDQIKARLAAQRAESYKECYEQSCQIELGRELAAQYTVSASLSRVGSQCLVSAAIYDLRKAATERTATARGECNADALLVAVERIAEKLSRPPRKNIALPPDITPTPDSQPAPWPPQQIQPTPATEQRQLFYQPHPPRREKKAIMALFWGLIIPGGGLYYCESYLWGTIYMLGSLGSFSVGMALTQQTHDPGYFLVSVAASGLIYIAAIVHGVAAAFNWKDPAYERWLKSIQASPSAQPSLLFQPLTPPAYSKRAALVVPVISFGF